MATFDQAQATRLGQRGEPTNTSVLMFSGSTIPEAPWTGMMIYRTDLQILQVFNGTAFEEVVGGISGILTFVGPEPPVANGPGDLWFDTDDGRKLYRWNGTAWVLFDDVRIGQTVIAAANAQAAAVQAGLDAAAAQFDADAANTAASAAQTSATQALLDADAAAFDALQAQITADAGLLLDGGQMTNPTFDDWPDSSAVPTGYTEWAGTDRITKDTAHARTKPYAVKFTNSTSTDSTGMRYYSTAGGASINVTVDMYKTLTLDFMLLDGGLGGAGVLVDFNGAYGEARVNVILSQIFPGGLAPNRWYRVVKVVKYPGTADFSEVQHIDGYVMGSWDGLGAAVAKEIVFDRVDLRTSTAAEIAAYSPTGAIITQLPAQTVDTYTAVAAALAPGGNLYKNASFEKDMVWLATPDTTVTYDAPALHSGTRSMKITRTGGGDAFATRHDEFYLNAGDTVTVSWYGRMNVAGGAGGPDLQGSSYYFGAGTFSYSDTETKRYSYTTTVPTAGLYWLVYRTSSTVTGYLLYDSIKVERGPKATAWSPNPTDAIDYADAALAAANVHSDARFPITTTDISDDAVTTPLLATNAVIAEKIAAGAVTANKLAIVMGGGNLLRDGGFESSGEAGAWSHPGSGEVYYVGQASLPFSIVSAYLRNGSFDDFLTQTGGQIQVRNNSVYTVSAWVYKESGAISCCFDRMLCIFNGAFYDGVSPGTPEITLDDGTVVMFSTLPEEQWLRIKMTFPTVSEALDVRLYFADDAEGIYFDNVQLEEGDYPTSYAPRVDEILPGTIVAPMIQADAVTTDKLEANAITSKHTITGPLFQTTATASRGIKISSAGMIGYNNVGVPTFSLSSSGTLSLIGAINSGSTITGTAINGSTITGGLFQTSSAPSEGIKISDGGMIAYDYANNPVFALDDNGDLVLKGNISAGSTIQGSTIIGTLIQTDDDGQRLLIRGDLSGGIIESYSGLSDETMPGLIDPGAQDFDDDQMRPALRFLPSRSTSYPHAPEIRMVSGDDIEGYESLVQVNSGRFQVNSDANIAITTYGNFYLRSYNDVIDLTGNVEIHGNISVSTFNVINGIMGFGSVGTGTFRDSVDARVTALTAAKLNQSQTDTRISTVAPTLTMTTGSVGTGSFRDSVDSRVTAVTNTRMQAGTVTTGTFTVGTNLQTTITFPTAFASTPKVQCTVAGTTTSASVSAPIVTGENTASCIVNITRSSGTAAVNVNWFAYIP